MLTLPRGRAPDGNRHGHVVDYRHVLHSLRRKPQALLNLVYREALFPHAAYRRTFEALRSLDARRACRTLVALLALAHDRACEAGLATALDALLDDGRLPDRARAALRTAPGAPPAVRVQLPLAATYDALLAPSRGTTMTTGPATSPMTGEGPIRVDTARLPLLLAELRLPSIARLWPQFTERADREGWPAARLLAVLAELELAERLRRRIERHLAEAHLPPGKTFDSFDFSAVPMLSKAHLHALATGDGWLDQGANLLLFGPPGCGKSPRRRRPRSRPGRQRLSRAVHPNHRPRPAPPGRAP